MRSLSAGRLHFFDRGTVFIAHDEDGKTGGAVEVGGAEACVVEFTAQVGVAVFVELGSAGTPAWITDLGEDFDVDFIERLFVAGVHDLEAAKAFADLDVEFVGVGTAGTPLPEMNIANSPLNGRFAWNVHPPPLPESP